MSSRQLKFINENNKEYLLLSVSGIEKKFEFISEIRPELDEDNKIKLKKFSQEEIIQYIYNKRKKNQDENIDLVKPLLEENFSLENIEKLSNSLAFCSFKLNTQMNDSGVYIWILDEEIIYIGETKKLKTRFNSGYGKISRRNIFKGGQSTNCKMNRVVLKNTKPDHYIKIYFLASDEYERKQLEMQLLVQEKFENNRLKYNAKI